MGQRAAQEPELNLRESAREYVRFSLRSFQFLALLVLVGCAGGATAPAEQQVILNFAASPQTLSAGQSARLSWDVAGAQSVSLGGVSAPADWSSALVYPIETTTYKLTATTSSGETHSREVTITVEPGESLARVAIDPAIAGRPVPERFLGFSHEWGQAQLMMGDPALGTNQIYRQLLVNLMDRSAGPLSIRIGGRSTDRLGPADHQTIAPLAQLAQDLNESTAGVSFIAGVNMGEGVPGLATQQVKALTDTMPLQSLQGIELGNQPGLYAARDYRAANYDFEEYLAEFRLFAQQIRLLVPNGPLFVAPAGGVGASPSASEVNAAIVTPENLERLLSAEFSNIGMVGQSSYVGASQACGGDARPGMLLEPQAATSGLEQIERYRQVARRAAKPLRLTEVNSINCAGEPRVSNAFEAALWASDTLFEYAYAGVSGVNLHTNLWSEGPGWDAHGAFLFDVPARQYQNSRVEVAPPAGTSFPGGYQLRRVQPLYYGMLFFAQAIANQAELLPLGLASDANFKAWATRDPASGNITLALINKDRSASGVVSLDVPGFSRGQVTRLVAASPSAETGISLGGMTFDESLDGKPVGTPYRETVEASNGRFEVALGAASALLLTLDR